MVQEGSDEQVESIYRDRYEELREKYIKLKCTFSELDVEESQNDKARAMNLERFVKFVFPKHYKEELGFEDWKDINDAQLQNPVTWLDLIQYYKHNLLKTSLFTQAIDRMIPDNSKKG